MRYRREGTTTMKTKILALLQNGAELTLTQITEQIGEKKENKPVVLYHLKRLIDEGKIRKNEDKTYSFVDSEGLKTINIECVTAKAGSNDVFYDENDKIYIPVAINMISHDPNDLLLVKVSGNSMEPTFSDGNILMFKKIKNTDEIQDNKIIVCRVDGGLKVKRYKDMGHYKLLLSDNFNYEHQENMPIPIDENRDFEILGRYVSRIN